MITIVAGSRSITDYEIVKEAIEKSGFDITCIVSGGQRRGFPFTDRRCIEKNDAQIQGQEIWMQYIGQTL